MPNKVKNKILKNFFMVLVILIFQDFRFQDFLFFNYEFHEFYKFLTN